MCRADGMPESPRIDWAQLVLNLRRKYRHCTRLAKEMNCSPVTLGKLSRGEVSEPMFGLGVRLIDEHVDTYGHLPRRD